MFLANISRKLKLSLEKMLDWLKAIIC